MTKEFNIQPMQTFLTKDIDIEELVNELDNIYYRFTDMAMRLSCLESEPIYEDAINARYWIERIKEVFAELK